MIWVPEPCSATDARDVIILHINPIARADTPRLAHEIENRLNEITFNAPLIAELRALELTGERRIRLHRIVMDDHALDMSSKLKTDFEFFSVLRKLGQRAARRFLDAHFNDIGRRSTIGLLVPAEREPA